VGLSSDIHAISVFKDTTEISADSKTKVLDDNPTRLYGM
jgi:hypothetical protein